MALSSVRRISAAGTIAILAIALAIAPGVSPAPPRTSPLTSVGPRRLPPLARSSRSRPRRPLQAELTHQELRLGPERRRQHRQARRNRNVELSGAGARQRAAAREGQREPPRRGCPHGVGPGRGAAVVALPRCHRLLRSRSRPPRRSSISRCCSRPPPATPTAPSRSRSGISTATATTTTAAARPHFAPSPMPGATWSGSG